MFLEGETLGKFVNQCHLLNENSDIMSEFFFSTSNPNFFYYYLTSTSNCAAFSECPEKGQLIRNCLFIIHFYLIKVLYEIL